MRKTKFVYEYPLASPNVNLYRKNGHNELKLFGYWDGGGNLEVYKTPDDGDCSLITIDILQDRYIYWYECKKKKPNVSDYKIKILRDIHCPKSERLILRAGETFKGFKAVFLP